MPLQVHEQLEDKIIRALANRPNRTAKDLHKTVSTKHHYSFQGVYKELKKLQHEGVVVKNKRHYSIRLPWALEFMALADNIEQTYINSPTLQEILPQKNKKQVWRFTNLLRMNEFWSQILLLLINQSASKILFGWNPHPWFHLAQTEQEEQYIRSLRLARSKLYLIVGGKTFFDRWAEQFWDQQAVEYSFSTSPFIKHQSHYINLIDDYILTVTLDDVTTQNINDIYKTVKSLDTHNLSQLIQIFNTKVKAKMTLENNPLKANKLRKKFSAFFGLKQK